MCMCDGVHKQSTITEDIFNIFKLIFAQNHLNFYYKFTEVLCLSRSLQLPVLVQVMAGHPFGAQLTDA